MALTSVVRPNGLSTVSGVFAPVAISMFSVLLFLRMGKLFLHFRMLFVTLKSVVFHWLTVSFLTCWLIFSKIAGFVVGQLGFVFTILQLLLAYTIVMLTVLSLCAISSNGAIEGGGVYCKFSRLISLSCAQIILLLRHIQNLDFSIFRVSLQIW